MFETKMVSNLKETNPNGANPLGSVKHDKPQWSI